jgi:hypothetical protein
MSTQPDTCRALALLDLSEQVATGDAIGTASPDALGPSPEDTRTEHSDYAGVVPAPANTATGPRPAGGVVRVGFRIQTQTAGRWVTVRVGFTDPLPRLDLNMTAETIFGNARQVLGLGPKAPMPPVRVQTWDEQSGRAGLATKVETLNLTALLRGD